jgi:hypothetical protein
METVPAEEFLRWAAAVGIGFHPHFPDSGCLCLLPLRKQARFWTVPPDPAHFTAALVNGLDEWSSGFLWPRSGTWPDPAQSRSYDEAVRDVFFRGAGIQGGGAGAVRFGHDEEDALLAILYATLAFGWCVDDDLFFIPDHAQQLLQTDHHNVIHVQCATEERVQSLVEHMVEAGLRVAH